MNIALKNLCLKFALTNCMKFVLKILSSEICTNVFLDVCTKFLSGKFWLKMMKIALNLTMKTALHEIRYENCTN